MTHPHRDDPRLTAYALDELDSAETAEVEALLESSAEARRVVQEVREATGLLTAGFAAEPTPSLAQEQREAVVAVRKSKTARPLLSLALVGGAIAATIVVAMATRRDPERVPLDQAAASVEAADAFLLEHVMTANRLDHVPRIYFNGVLDPQEATRGVAPTKRVYVDGDIEFRGMLLANGAPLDPTKKSSFYDLGFEWSSHGLPQIPAGADDAANTTAGWGADPVSPNKVVGLRAALPPGLQGAVALGSLDSHNRESYDPVRDNRFLAVKNVPLSTFGADVDTASYSNVRRFLRQGVLPPPAAVRIEEMLNYFSYDYAPPRGEHPFAAHIEVAGCPWDTTHRLVRIGLKGRVISNEDRPATNLVFLVDVSGSMESADKLPLVQQSLRLLLDRLDERDRVAIVVYAGESRVVLRSTGCEDKPTIRAAIDGLTAGGSTNGGSGIQMAYDAAAANFLPGGANRVILLTDGDFNVGVTNRNALVEMIAKKAQGGVFLSVLGFGMGNLQDATLEGLADKGNGTYGYIDGLREARKVFVEGLTGTLTTIAKDVKFQVEFNPVKVAGYRLVGYENRKLAARDFTDDKKDAGDVGAGHTVTALYEIVLAGSTATYDGQPLEYQTPKNPTPLATEGSLLTVKLRYKQPDGHKSVETKHRVFDEGTTYASSTGDFKFAAGVAAFGMILRRSPHAGNATLDSVLELAGEGLGEDPGGHRAEFLDLVRRAKALGR